ncbi:hypothetical protein DYB32_010157 [Aphanomyces invadans]|uniref:Serine aminopeptidase S33 domain-containing protein n=1 Tax=Aphanomyces invadans TaxID=157072 RepID=A0A418ANK2_9STRA|nr:hypothetical protein DYB32_010157 [Aphanomyces invadans]
MEQSVPDALDVQEFTSVHTATLPNGLRVEYALHGHDEAPQKVVLVMGLAAEKEAWTSFVTAFFCVPNTLNTFQLATVDNRGVGGTDAPKGRYSTSSMAQDVLLLMDHLQWNTFHIAGVRFVLLSRPLSWMPACSMGGMISQEVAYAAPTRVRSLTLMVSTPGFTEAPWPRWTQISAYLSLIGNFFNPTLHARTQTMLKVLYPDEYMENVAVGSALYTIHSTRIKTSRVRTRGLIGQYAAVLSHRMPRSRLAKIKDAEIPVLIIGGGKDRLLPSSHSEALGCHLDSPHTTIVVIQGGGHGIFTQFRTDVTNAFVQHMTRSDRSMLFSKY